MDVRAANKGPVRKEGCSDECGEVKKGATYTVLWSPAALNEKFQMADGFKVLVIWILTYGKFDMATPHDVHE